MLVGTDREGEVGAHGGFASRGRRLRGTIRWATMAMAVGLLGGPTRPRSVRARPAVSAGGPRDRGEALFAGGIPLRGKIRAHAAVLPSEVVRCANCHRAVGKEEASASASAAPFAPPPRLDRTLLLVPRMRRGGPPSSYDVASFCRLLRTGVDPVYILVAREMPLYDLDETDCLALWRYLTKDGTKDGTKE